MVKEFTHVDDWIDSQLGEELDQGKTAAENLRYLNIVREVKSWMNEFRKSVTSRDIKKLRAYALFCIYDGKRYRVTGCSRFGDVWLSRDLERLTGYDLRIDVMGCSGWEIHPSNQAKDA